MHSLHSWLDKFRALFKRRDVREKIAHKLAVSLSNQRRVTGGQILFLQQIYERTTKNALPFGGGRSSSSWPSWIGSSDTPATITLLPDCYKLNKRKMNTKWSSAPYLVLLSHLYPAWDGFEYLMWMLALVHDVGGARRRLETCLTYASLRASTDYLSGLQN